jgi:hypothetical protein
MENTNENKWLESRLGRFTASEVSRLLTDPTIAEKKEGEKLSKGAKTFCEEVASEIITGLPYEDNMRFAEIKAIEWGKAHEKEAYMQWLIRFHGGDEDKGTHFGGDNPQFFTLENFEFAGYSPDFISHVYGEIKCPNTTTHLKYIQMSKAEDLKKLKPEYYYQMQMGMMGHKLDTGHFVSYDPRMLKAMMYVLTIPQDNEAQDLICAKLEAASEYVKNLIADIETLSGGKTFIHIV